jgi:Ca2+-binding EF-hand superfamily protein
MNVIDLNQNGLIEFSEFLILAQSGDSKIDKKLAYVFDAFGKLI